MRPIDNIACSQALISILRGRLDRSVAAESIDSVTRIKLSCGTVEYSFAMHSARQTAARGKCTTSALGGDALASPGLGGFVVEAQHRQAEQGWDVCATMFRAAVQKHKHLICAMARCVWRYHFPRMRLMLSGMTCSRSHLASSGRMNTPEEFALQAAYHVVARGL